MFREIILSSLKKYSFCGAGYRRRSFLLLEVLIALSLTLTCALPMASLPSRALKEEIAIAYDAQARRLADLAFAQLKERLYKNEIPWEQIARCQEGRQDLFEDTYTVSLPSAGTRKFKGKVSLKFPKKFPSKQEQGIDTYFLLVARIQIKPAYKKTDQKNQVFSHLIIVHKSSQIPPV